MKQIAAIVLAAGKGSRMGSELHKVLHTIDGKPMLAHVLSSLEILGVQQTVVVVGAGREQIHQSFPDLVTAIQDEQLGTGHAVRMAQGALAAFTGVVLVLYGDVPLVRAETLRRLCDRIDDKTWLAVLGFRPPDTQTYGRLVTNENGQLLRIVEHADANASEREIGFCNSGIIAARSDILFDLLAQVRNDNAKGEYYLTDVVGLAGQAGYKVATAEADPLEVTGVNSQQELEDLNRKAVDYWFS